MLIVEKKHTHFFLWKH